jgi:hypothetical protein
MHPRDFDVGLDEESIEHPRRRIAAGETLTFDKPPSLRLTWRDKRHHGAFFKSLGDPLFDTATPTDPLRHARAY